MTNQINANSFYQTAIRAAKEAGAYQKSKWNTSLEIEYKGDINLVTEVDRACEEKIIRIIQASFPDHDILAEEGSATRKDSVFKWIIDPLDGTTNFAHAYPLFCVSIALEVEGEIVGAVVYEPLREELFKAYKGCGAFLNDKSIHVSQKRKINDSMLATGFAYNIREARENNLDHFRNMLLKSQAVRRDGVAAIDLCYLACGRYDGFWELNLFPWDTAAGILIVKEAGGLVSRFDGSGYTVYEKDILASNSLIHDEMVETIKKGMNRYG